MVSWGRAGKRTPASASGATVAALTGRSPHDAAETVPGPSTRFFADLAREHGVYLTVPLVEVDRRTGRYYNKGRCGAASAGPGGARLIA